METAVASPAQTLLLKEILKIIFTNSGEEIHPKPTQLQPAFVDKLVMPFCQHPVLINSAAAASVNQGSSSIITCSPAGQGSTSCHYPAHCKRQGEELLILLPLKSHWSTQRLPGREVGVCGWMAPSLAPSLLQPSLHDSLSHPGEIPP